MPDVISHLREAGFSDDEIGAWTTTTRQNLKSAGFDDDEVDGYLGVPKTPKGIPAAFAQRMEAGRKLVDFYGRLVTAAGKGAVEGFGDEPVGIDPAKERELYQTLGIPDGVIPLVSGLPGAQLVKQGAAALDAMMRGTNAGIRGIAEAAGVVGEAAGQSQGMNERMKHDINSLGQVAMLLAAPMDMTRAPFRVSAKPGGARTADQLGGLPRGEDFSTASTVIGHGDTTPAMEAKLSDLYEQQGIHPAEVAHDAQSDVTITQSILSSDKEDVPAAYQAPAAPADPIDARIRDAYRAESQDGTDFVPLAKIRDQLSDLDRSEVDAGLLRVLQGKVKGAGLSQISDPKRLTTADREAAFAPGGEPFNVLHMTEDARDLLDERQPSSAGAAAVPPPSYTDAEQQILSKISIDEKSPEAKLTWGKLYTRVFDKIYPIGKAVKEAEPGLPAEDNPYQLARLLTGHVGKSDHFLNQATFDFHTYEANGPSLKSILAPVKDDLNGFRAYAAAARALELEGRGIKSGFDAGDMPSAPPLVSSGLDAARTVVVEGREKFAKPFLDLVDYQNRVTAYLRDSGVLSDAGYSAMVDANKLYVPFTRVMGIDETAQARGGSTLQATNPIKAIKGSARSIVDPIESIVRNTYHMIEMAERNVVGTKLVDMLKRASEDLPEAPAAASAVSGTEPLLKAGYTRFYRGEKPGGTAFNPTIEPGRYFSTDRSLAAKYGNDLYYVDLSPNDMRGIAQDANMPNKPSFILEKKLADQKQLLIETPPESPRAAAMAEALGEVGIRNPDDLAGALAHASEPVRAGEIAILRDGKRETYRVDPELAAAMKGLDAQSMGMLERMLAYPASVLRAGAVTTPDFALRHTIRDFLYATTTFKGGVFTPLDMAKGFSGLIMKDSDYWNWMKGGGGNISMVGMDRQYLQTDLRKLTGQTGLMGRAWNVLADPNASMWQKTSSVGTLPFQAIEKFVLDPLRALTQFAENASHLGAFKKTMRTAEQAGDTDLRSQIIRAAWNSRDTAVDAARMGANMRAYNMITAFANIKLQDTDRVVRAIIDNPVSSLTKIGGAITVPSVLLWAANHDDPRYAEIPQWQKDMFWLVMTPNHVFRVPKPWGMGLIFGSGPERLLDAFVAHKPEAFKEYFKSIWAASGPDFVPTGASPIIDQFANRSTFTNRTLIPSAQEKFLPEYQYTPYTTELTKELGKMVGAFPGMSQVKMENSGWGGVAKAVTSPILIENYIRGWTGTLGVYALQAADAGLRKAGVLPDPPQPTSTLADIPVIKAFVVRYPSAAAESVQNFQDEYAKNKTFFATYMAMAKDGNVAAMQHIQDMGGPMMFVQLDGIHQTVLEHNQLVRDIYKNPQIPPDEKRQLIDQLYLSMIQVSRHGMDAIRQMHKQAADTIPH